MEKRHSVAEPNYVRKIRHMARCGLLPLSGGYHEVTVDHDDWCGHWQGKRCNCNPDVRLKFSLPAAADN
jgi:hypothetical protein